MNLVKSEPSVLRIDEDSIAISGICDRDFGWQWDESHVGCRSIGVGIVEV